MLTVALVGNLGNSVMVRGGLEVLLDATAEALEKSGVRVLRALALGDPKPDLFHFFGQLLRARRCLRCGGRCAKSRLPLVAARR